MLDLTALYEVMIYSVGETKAGTKMGKLQVKNLTDNKIMNCIMWEETISRISEKTFRSGNIIKILSGTYNEKFNNCLVSDVQLVEESKHGLDEEERNLLFNKIIERISKIEDKKIEDFTFGLLREHEEKFKSTPAARLMHHNYPGGLLQHTFECMTIADKVVDMFPEKINRDETVAAAILHDIGKIFEYILHEDTGIIEYDNEFYGMWISHSQWGYSACMAAGFPRIAKMIAAHHGRIDWGSMIDFNQKDLEPYVYVIHHIDDLSAKFGKTSVSDL